MYLVELGQGVPKRASETKESVAVSDAQRYRPVRSIEEIEADVNEGDQSGLDVVIGHYRGQESEPLSISSFFEAILNAFQLMHSYFQGEKKPNPPETWYK